MTTNTEAMALARTGAVGTVTAPTPVMPELPEPEAWMCDALYSADQLHAYSVQFAAAQNAELQARIVELEEAIHSCLNWANGRETEWGERAEIKAEMERAK